VTRPSFPAVKADLPVRLAAACLAGAALLAGCAAPGTAPDHSRTALDWAGRYEGTLPCADCPGIHTTLELRPDQSYRLTQRYLERNVAPVVEQGHFRWNRAGQAIELLDLRGGPIRYSVGEGRLTQLDREGRPITGPLAPMYVLRQVGR
jgi:uncharacterized lipoprotein NlpE involved in copper resistance